MQRVMFVLLHVESASILTCTFEICKEMERHATHSASMEIVGMGFHITTWC